MLGEKLGYTLLFCKRGITTWLLNIIAENQSIEVVRSCYNNVYTAGKNSCCDYIFHVSTAGKQWFYAFKHKHPRADWSIHAW